MSLSRDRRHIVLIDKGTHASKLEGLILANYLQMEGPHNCLQMKEPHLS